MIKKILYVSAMLAVICGQSISISHASEVEMSNDEFTNLVCGYLHSTDYKTEAISKIKTAIGVEMNDSQIEKLAEIVKSEQATKDICAGFLPRL